jgi:phytol kinase
MHQSLRAWLVTGAVAAGWVGSSAAVGRRRLLPPHLSRKLLHIGTGPLSVACWPLYSGAASSAWLAASMPLAATAVFALVGSGAKPDALGLSASATRSGRREELLRGPLLYGLVHAALAVACWRTPAAVLTVAVLCGGNGAAEVVGRSVASPRLPWNGDKSVAGSLGCLTGGATVAAPLLRFCLRSGAFAPVAPDAGLAAGVLLVAMIGAAVESLPAPVEGGDNVTVPLAFLFASRLYFKA